MKFAQWHQGGPTFIEEDYKDNTKVTQRRKIGSWAMTPTYYISNLIVNLSQDQYNLKVYH